MLSKHDNGNNWKSWQSKRKVEQGGCRGAGVWRWWGYEWGGRAMDWRKNQQLPTATTMPSREIEAAAIVFMRERVGKLVRVGQPSLREFEFRRGNGKPESHFRNREREREPFQFPVFPSSTFNGWPQMEGVLELRKRLRPKTKRLSQLGGILISRGICC